MQLTRNFNLNEFTYSPTAEANGYDGYRCLALNRKLNSKDSSQHRTGNAADLIIPGIPLKDVYEYIRVKLPYDQLLFETDKKGTQWIHVSYKKNGYNRKQALEIIS